MDSCALTHTLNEDHTMINASRYNAEQPQQPQRAQKKTSVVQLLRDHSTIDATVRSLLEAYGVHPSDLRVFAFGECARHLRFRPGVAASVVEVDPERLRGVLSKGALDQEQADLVVARLLDGDSLLVVNVHDWDKVRVMKEYLASRGDVEKRKEELAAATDAGRASQLGDEESQPRERVMATEKASDRKAHVSSRYARASRTDGVGHWGS